MSRLTFSIISAVFLAATLASGWIHGSMANRWGKTDDLQTAPARLGRDLPVRLGPWRLAKTLKVEPQVAQKLQCAGALHGIYTNDQTGDAVNIAVLAGPSGPLTVHTPEICYSATNYDLAGDRRQASIETQDGQTHSLWNIHANSRHADRPNIRIMYGWSQGGAWRAVRGPRFALAGLPVLYKLQLSGPALSGRAPSGPGQAGSANNSKPNEGLDPCQDFLSRFLAEIQPRLMTAKRNPFPAS